jgi:hypothetical protein
MDLQKKMNERLDHFLPDLLQWNFHLDNETTATYKSIFQLYKQNTDEIFKLFTDLLASLPHVQKRQRRQWDVVAFGTATAVLSLATYNTVQISKFETAIEAQQAKTDLLTDISKLHELHMHKLDNMVDDIGKELQGQILIQYRHSTNASFHVLDHRHCSKSISNSSSASYNSASGSKHTSHSKINNTKRFRKTPSTSARRKLSRSSPWLKSTTRAPTIPEKMPIHLEDCWEGCPTNRGKSPKTSRRIPSHFPSLLIILYGLLKMTSGMTVLDPDPELINAQNFDFAKPKSFFKNICKYAATSTYIHVRIPFNFTTVFNTKKAIAGVYDQLLAQHDEPFKSITKSVTDVSLSIIEGSLEDFCDFIKALPQKMEISTPHRPK